MENDEFYYGHRWKWHLCIHAYEMHVKVSTDLRLNMQVLFKIRQQNCSKLEKLEKLDKKI